MKEKSKKSEILRFAFLARRPIDGKAEPGDSGIRDLDAVSDKDLLGYLAHSLPNLPGAERKEELKSACLEMAPRMLQGEITLKKSVRQGRVRVLPALAKVAMALVVILVVFALTGFASVYAMPGNPLYSVKRTIENTRLSIASGGEDSAELLLGYAEERLDEIEYVEKRKMKGWRYALAEDAQEDIEKVLKESKRLYGESGQRVCSRAGRCSSRLAGLIENSSFDLSPGQEEELQRRMKRCRMESQDSSETTPENQDGSVVPGEDSNTGNQQQGNPEDGTEQESDTGSYPSDSGNQEQPYRQGQQSTPGNKQ